MTNGGLGWQEGGRIRVRVKLLPLFVRRANASLVFDIQDAFHYRFVRVQPGRLVIGQVGDFGGAAGCKKKTAYGFRTGRWYSLRVDYDPSGGVSVYDGANLVDSYAFPAGASGLVGVEARKAKSLFDDFFLWDGAVLNLP